MKIHPLILLDEEQENEDDTISTPDTSILRRQVNNLCQRSENVGSREGSNDPVLESLSQEFLLKKRLKVPLKRLKMQAGIKNNLFIKK